MKVRVIFRVMFLVLIVMSPVAFAQTDEAPKAWKFDEFENATNEYVNMRLQSFLVDLSSNPAALGLIINYGTAREIAVRERQIRDAISFFRYDPARITIVRGGFWKNVKTECWTVPPGAETPAPSSNAELVAEFRGRVTSEDLGARLDKLYASLNKDANLQGFVVIYGPAKQIALQETSIKKIIALRQFDLARITFKKSSLTENEQTEFWIVPADVENKSGK